MANSNFDKQLSQMQHLMFFDEKPLNESKVSKSIEYKTIGADDKVYGIVKEGQYYYIKTAEQGKETLAENYDFIGGENNKKANQYKSYNEATKQLELKLMSLNESCGNRLIVETADPMRKEKDFMVLTEEARKELDRMHQIFENSTKIGMNNTGNPEAPKTAEFSEKIGKPFEETAKAELDKDLKATAKTPAKQGEPFEQEEKVTDAKLEDDKNPGSAEKPVDDYTKAEYVPKDAVAAKEPKGAKNVSINDCDAARMNEGEEMDELDTIFQEFDEDFFHNPDVADDEQLAPLPDEVDVPELANDEENINIDIDAFPANGEDAAAEELTDEEPTVGDDIVGVPTEEPELAEACENGECKCGCKDGKCTCGGEKALKGPNGTLPVQSWDKLNESQKRQVEKIVEGVYSKLFEGKAPKKSNGLQEKINAMVNEEMTRLDAWGKHPKYGKEPMTTPDNKEVVKNQGDKDWNDDSVKGNERYGRKIGKSDPFTQNVGELTDAVMKELKESIIAKLK